MFIKLADAIDKFLFGETKSAFTESREPTKVRILRPGQSLGSTTNTFAPPEHPT